MSWQLIDSDGISETWSYIDTDGKTWIVDRQNDKPLLERNKMLRGSESTIDSGMRPIASIPMTLARKWLKEDGINEAEFWQWKGKEQHEYWRKKYLSSDYQDLRTSPKPITKLWYSDTHYKAIDTGLQDKRTADQFAKMKNSAANDNFTLPSKSDGV